MMGITMLKAPIPFALMRDRPLVLGFMLVSLGLALAGWVAMALFGRRVVESIGTEGLVAIGLVAGLHFVVTYTSMIVGTAIRTLLGPFALFITGIADEKRTAAARATCPAATCERTEVVASTTRVAAVPPATGSAA